jgi:hypothetical protein
MFRSRAESEKAEGQEENAVQEEEEVVIRLVFYSIFYPC